MTEFKEIMKKMCVIGEAAAGKTSLIRRFVVDKFDDKYIVTIGTKTSKKILTIKDKDVNVSLKLMIWDILGQSHFEKLKQSAFKGSNGAFIVLDLTRKETLESFEKWLSSLYNVVPGIPVIILANKNDLKMEFGAQEIEDLVKDYGFPYYLTSAKTGENVNDAFYTIGKMMIEGWKCAETQPSSEIKEVAEELIDEEMVLDKELTAIEVEDIIMARYCELLEDPEYAMAIIREQFKRADVDFRNPTPQGLLRVVEFIINAAADQVEASRLKHEKKTYSDLIRMIDRQDTITIR
ncbi:MAG: GTP-binding protein [Thermoplasmata archaeon]|nr:MAG: GTP-binding protein [Thermoplasmata archaeon]